MDVAIATMTAAPRATYRPNGSIPDSDIPVPGTATSVAPRMVRCGRRHRRIWTRSRVKYGS
jgi:hypothetical protein